MIPSDNKPRGGDLFIVDNSDSDHLLKVHEVAPKPQDVANEIVNGSLRTVAGVVAVNLNAAVRHLRVWRERGKRNAERAGGQHPDAADEAGASNGGWPLVGSVPETAEG